MPQGTHNVIPSMPAGASSRRRMSFPNPASIRRPTPVDLQQDPNLAATPLTLLTGIAPASRQGVLTQTAESACFWT